jgi:hypothetical protein
MLGHMSALGTSIWRCAEVVPADGTNSRAMAVLTPDDDFKQSTESGHPCQLNCSTPWPDFIFVSCLDAQ